VKFRVKASAMVASTTARPTHWRPVGFYSTAPTGLKFGSRAYECPLWVKSGHRERLDDVRFTPKSGHYRVQLGCPLCAKSGLLHCSK
jgi:hypothetical protein